MKTAALTPYCSNINVFLLLLLQSYHSVLFQDLASELLTMQLGAILGGLQDSSDDVRGVAAAALLPVSDHMVTALPQQVLLMYNTVQSQLFCLTSGL